MDCYLQSSLCISHLNLLNSMPNYTTVGPALKIILFAVTLPRFFSVVGRYFFFEVVSMHMFGFFMHSTKMYMDGCSHKSKLCKLTI